MARLIPGAGIECAAEGYSVLSEDLAKAAQGRRFERLMLPHLDAAYTLAFWLTRNEDLARDAVQEALLRAYRYFGAFRGEDGRPWLLRIVRNACCELLERERAAGAQEELDERLHSPDGAAPGAVLVLPVNPEAAAIERAGRELVHACLRSLPHEYREVVILRELHGCSYKEIAAICGVPIGTVMSRLARGRRLLQFRLAQRTRSMDTGT
jgi:RNA polymerase sigma-70 factor (ECF subfamily)